jgi:hypothetical protein
MRHSDGPGFFAPHPGLRHTSDPASITASIEATKKPRSIRLGVGPLLDENERSTAERARENNGADNNARDDHGCFLYRQNVITGSGQVKKWGEILNLDIVPISVYIAGRSFAA